MSDKSDKNSYYKNNMFAKWMKKVKYNVNDPEKKRIQAIINFINKETKKETKKRNERHHTKPSVESIKYYQANNAYIMLNIVHKMPRRFNINQEQCNNLKNDLEHVIKKYNFTEKHRRDFDNTVCDRKFKTKKNRH